ncbi:MAG: hypothetical protein Q8P41_03015 [Pseudomonadota bacterium]|nr:hypothetical protein [Pseudomonadota bacterium]
MISAFLSALFGRCPSCHRGKLYKSFMALNETCPVCHVRFERWSGSWTIPTVMGYGSGAFFAIGLGFVFFRMGRLEGSENIIIPATITFTALFYPVCKNLSMFMLFQNGFIFVDPPTLVRDEPAGVRNEPASVQNEPASSPPPVEDDPTCIEERALDQDDPTDGGGRVA